jgi:predicted metal-dependent peptidase
MSKIQNINEASGWDTDANGKKWEDYDTIVCPDGQVIDMVQLLDEQQRAKAALLHIMPFFGGFASKLRPVYTFRVPTQAVDGVNLFINPQFTYNLDLTGKVFVMAHEIMHCVLNHMRRGKGHNHERSNIAADYEVNAWINDIGLIRSATMEKLGALYDKKYSGWGYEKIYADNPSGPKDSMDNSGESNKAQQQQDKQQSGQQQGGGSSSSGNGQQQYGEDYKKGWAQAMEDYKKGKLKI